ncbi:hypothetical protein BJY00DRAFT_314571 [Aspergillus carlsbadensis]|nr:hypothetical protein BJY00DRAFT_314571 [Aspergillus carlsbadensis]
MRPKSRKDYTIAIICALPLEADAVEALFDEHHDRLGKYYGVQQGDANAYINGRIGKHNVVLCYMPGMGKGSAAAAASSLQVSYTGIELALVVGICGGGPSPPKYEEIFLGDVIISDSVLKYDFGRQYPGGFQRKTDHIQDTFGRPVRRIRTLLNGLRAENSRREFQEQTQQYLQTLQRTHGRWNHPRVRDVLFKASYLHKHYDRGPGSVWCTCRNSGSSDEICEVALGQPCDDLDCDRSEAVRYRDSSENTLPAVYIGTVASADTVMKSGQHRDEIVRKEKVIGFEMEGSGVWDNVPCIIIKGVCDYADSHKNKLWQAYAAATGASAAKTFLEYWMPADHGADASTTRHLMLPFERNTRFVGRQSELRQLEHLMSLPDGPTKIAIAGLGGVGKTQIALELAYRMRDREPDCSIFWIPCTSYEAVEQAYLTIAQMLGIQVANPAEVKQRLKTHFSQDRTKWLIIFDNADDTDMWTQGTDNNAPLRDFLPSNKQGRIVLTTRNRELAVDLVSSDIVNVRELDEKSGVEFLEKALPRNLPVDRQAMIELLEQLEFLPLAISQATAYISKKGITVSDYLVLLQEQETDVVELLSRDFTDERRYKDAQNPVAKTWLISFSQIEKLNILAAEYLQLMACVSPRDIPHSFLPPGSKLEMADALGLLSAYSLVTLNPENQDITLHRLVHLAMRNWLRNEKRYDAYITKTADRLSEIFPPNKHENRQLWRAYLPQAQFLLGDSTFATLEENYTDLMKNVGTCLCSDGRYAEAERLQIQVLEIRTRTLGPKDLGTLTSVNHLVFNYLSQYEWKKAEELEGPALEARKEMLGLEHPTTLISMGNMATIHYNQGRWKQAEELVSQALTTQKRILGPEHQETLITMSHLIPLIQAQGRWQEAEELAAQLLETRKRLLGVEHPHTLSSMGFLAGAYQYQSKWIEAEELELQALDIKKKVLGPDSPDTLTSMARLAFTYHFQQRWGESEDLGIRTLAAQKQLLGPAHPATLGTMHNLTATLKEGGKASQALTLMQACVDLRTDVLGADHPDTICSRTVLEDWKKSGEQTQHVSKTSRDDPASKLRKWRDLRSLFRR